jgi:hypothetical protein
MPGGELKGSVKPVPAQWTDVPDTIQVEFNSGEDPYSINIWGLGLGAELYIATGEDGTRWSEFLQSDSDVRVRMGDEIYELEATRLDDPDLRIAVVQGYADKYDVDPTDGWVQEGMIFKLSRRDGS